MKITNDGFVWLTVDSKKPLKYGKKKYSTCLPFTMTTPRRLLKVKHN